MRTLAPERPLITSHGARDLPRVHVDSYNLELRAGRGFLGDHANKGAFAAIFEATRRQLREAGGDPLDGRKVGRRDMDKILSTGDPEAAAMVETAIERFAQDFASVLRRLLQAKAWRGTERIVVGGGMGKYRVGEIIIGRAAVLLKTDKVRIDLRPLCRDPDEAALIGSTQLAPAWVLRGYDSMLAVDIGGTHMRAGIVELRDGKRGALAKSRVGTLEKWTYAAEKKTITRHDAVKRLAGMLRRLIRQAQRHEGVVAPLVGIGCPGLITDSGRIERGGQNLPGNWERASFSLPQILSGLLPRIDGHQPVCMMHNDAVVQGLSEVPRMTDVERWGVLTIGTGLGNARFTNR